MSNEATVELSDVQISTKLVKKTKKGKDFFIFESNKGSLMCFDPSTANKIVVSDTAVYTLQCEDYAPSGEHKNYTVRRDGVLKVTEGAARPAQASAPRSAEEKHYVGTPKSAGSGMNGDMARDTRISKLSIFAAIAQIQASKLRVNPEMAEASTAAIIAETIMLTEGVIKELVYPVPEPIWDGKDVFEAPVAPTGNTTQQPATTAQAPAPASVTMPPVSLRPETPYLAQQPAQVNTAPATPPTPAPVMTQTAADKTAQAKALFGVKTDLESAMAARVQKMLSKTP